MRETVEGVPSDKTIPSDGPLGRMLLPRILLDCLQRGSLRVAD